jgi:hypothetical protein
MEIRPIPANRCVLLQVPDALAQYKVAEKDCVGLILGGQQ